MIDETVEEIQEMQTHSSSVVAVKAARALETLTEREFASLDEYVRDVERNATALRQANPSHASLQNTQREIVDALDAEFESIEAAKSRTKSVVRSVIERVEMAKRRAAEYGAIALEDGMTVLTHDYSSTVLEAIELAARDGAELTVYVTEARPRYLGRKSARTLASIDRIDTHLIVDSACDWGISEPLAVAKTAKLALENGIAEETVRKVTYANTLEVYGKSGQIHESDWLDPPAIDQRTLYEGNSILRGGREPRIETPGTRNRDNLIIE